MVIHVPGRMEKDNTRFHYAIENCLQIKIYEFLISEIFKLIFSDDDWPWVTEITENKTMDKEVSIDGIIAKNPLMLTGCLIIWVRFQGHIITPFHIINLIYYSLQYNVFIPLDSTSLPIFSGYHSHFCLLTFVLTISHNPEYL